MKHFTLLIFVYFFFSLTANAVTGRHPTGVNVNANGPTTVVITFHNLETNEQPVDAFWCGDVTASGVVVGTNPCVSGTLLGHLPKQFDLSRVQGESTIGSGNIDLPGSGGIGTSRNMNDVMSIPVAVIRRAYQQAQAGASSEFFYIRQFINNGISTYVTVTCRMAGGGARSPLALTKVDLDFKYSSTRKAITLVQQGESLSPFSAEISYTGTGLLKGRWEVVTPGDVEPTRFDLLSAGSIPVEDRTLQKRYRLVSRFQKFLPPTGKAIISGPDPKLLPTNEKGAYQILFRVEASNDKEGNTDTLSGIVNTGGAAGFPMPTLKYFVGSQGENNQPQSLPPISLLLPQNKDLIKNKSNSAGLV